MPDVLRQKLENRISIGLIKMIQWLKNLFQDRNFGAKRDSHWASVRKEYMQKFPLCAICGKKGLLRSNECHHILPFHLYPTLELNTENFITLCRTCHLSWGHLFSFKSYNADIRKDTERIKNRP